MDIKFSKITVKLILGVCLIISYNKSFAQDNINNPSQQKVIPGKVTPPSPQTASLGKFGDIPVGNYTGVPDISIPIYSFKVFGQDFPISLNYHAGGIRVEEVASNVGLGWALSAGGVVGATVEGLSDFGPGGFISNDHYITNTFNPIYTNTDQYQAAKKILAGELDSQPDLFFYNFPGHSGKFTFDQSGNPHLIPSNTNLIISKDQNGFKITDEQGTVYNFNTVESVSQNTDLAVCPLPLTTFVPDPGESWYLSSVVYRNGDIVNIQYEGDAYSYKNHSSESFYTPYPDNYYCDAMSPNPRVCSSLSNFATPMVKTITYRDLSIVFNYSTTSRLDLNGSEALQSVVISNKSNILHTWTLNYNYFNGGGTPPSSASQLDKDTYYKLKLVSVTQDNFPPYKLDYFEDGIFPNRMSNAVDYWGYYNGKGNTTGSMLPDLNTEVGHIAGVDRNPYEGFAKMGTLKKVTYPTGGFSQLDFENNTYYGCQQQKLIVNKGAAVLASSDPLDTAAHRSFDITSKSINIRVLYSQGNVSTQFGSSLIINGPNNFHASFTGDSPSGGEVYPLPPGHYYINASSLEENPSGFLSFTWQERTDTTICQNWLGGGIRIKSITSSANSGAPVMVKNYEYKLPSDNSKSSGFVVNPPNYGEIQLYPRMYVNTAGGQAAGTEIVIDTQHPCRYFVTTAFSTVPLGNIQGANVGYEYVTIYDQGATNNGKSQFQYTKYDDLAQGRNVYPYPPASSNDWLRGLLLEQIDFKFINNQYSRIRRLTNSYTINNNPDSFSDYQIHPNINETNVLGIKIGSFIPEFSFPVFFPAQFVLGYFKRTSAWYTLKSTTVKEYNSADTTYANVNVTNYFYDNPTHLQLTRTVSTTSDGKTISAVTTYPDDYTPGTGFIDDMKTAHLVSLPIERVSYQSLSANTNILGGVITQYKSGGKGLPNKVYKFESPTLIPIASFKFSDRAMGALPYGTKSAGYKADTCYQEKLTYDQYDEATGNVLTITPKNGSSIGYQWGYNKTYPIAECRNATTSEFYYEGFEESTATGVTSGTSHTGTKYTTNSTVNWTKPNSRSYKISYWYLSGGSWKYMGEQNYVGPSFVMTGGTAYDDIRIYPSDAQITTYTYAPLVGITSTMDAKGEMTTYEYDSFQRLMNVKDKDGNIVKHMDYHYPGQ